MDVAFCLKIGWLKEEHLTMALNNLINKDHIKNGMSREEMITTISIKTIASKLLENLSKNRIIFKIIIMSC